MANKEFILQGFTKRTHAAAARELFDVDGVQRVIISVAFVSASGVMQLAKQLEPTKTKVFVLAGIRNDITSYQGLTALKELAADVYTVDTGSRTVLFHPKLYLVRGKDRARLLIGSANLTLGGLNNNIEAGMLVEFDLTDATEKGLVDEIEVQLMGLPATYPEHVAKVKSKAMLDALLKSGRLVDEMAMPAPRPTTATAGKSGDTITRIKLQVPAVRSILAKAKAAPKPITVPTAKKKPKGTKGAKAVSTPNPASPSVGVEMELVWESTPLRERDLSIPKGKNTNITGAINLDRGLLEKEVDFQFYFRNDVFSAVEWQLSKTGKKEEAYAKFQLVLKGVSYGEFDLCIRHIVNTSETLYIERHQALTSLSWGPARQYIGQPDLLGRTLALYRDKVDPTRFVLEID